MTNETFVGYHCPRCGNRTWEHITSGSVTQRCISCGYPLDDTREMTMSDRAYKDMLADLDAKPDPVQEALKAFMAAIPQLLESRKKESRVERLVFALLVGDAFCRETPNYLANEVVNTARDIDIRLTKIENMDAKP